MSFGPHLFGRIRVCISEVSDPGPAEFLFGLAWATIPTSGGGGLGNKRRRVPVVRGGRAGGGDTAPGRHHSGV